MPGRSKWLALVPLVLVLILLAGREVARGGVLTGDTFSVMAGAASADNCLHHGQFRCHGVDHWALLQYLPAIGFRRLGVDNVGNALLLLNGACVLGVFALLYLAGRRRDAPSLAPLAVAAALVSPL